MVITQSQWIKHLTPADPKECISSRHHKQKEDLSTFLVWAKVSKILHNRLRTFAESTLAFAH
jgi:hypothetical protein